MAVMRIGRLFSLLLAILTTGLLVAPAAAAEPPLRLATQITDQAGALSASQAASVQRALDRLYDDRRIKLWVVFVEDFSGQNYIGWAQNTMRLSDFGDDDALLAVATVDRAFAFQVPDTLVDTARADDIRRNSIGPSLRREDWAGAAIAAADQLNTEPASATGAGCRGPRCSSCSASSRCSSGSCGSGRGDDAPSGARPSSRRPNAWTPPIRTLWRACRSGARRVVA